MEFPKQYAPKNFEKALTEKWEQEGKFQPKESTTDKTFYIPMPPPNVTGNLHLGHAMTLTLEDIMVRYHRMKGDATLWVPGTDHAGIATQARVEKMLAESGRKREEMGREAFLDEVWKWKDQYAANINNQARQMGASCDWTRERFTFDEGMNRNVNHAFVDLYNKGLLYRGEYMVNYSPALGSVISDIEVDYKEEEAKLYYITYFVSGSDNELVLATTRPETLLADQAVAVHPKDKRFKKLIGRKVILPIVNKEIDIIGDEMVDMEFGTGVVKITPAHDPADFETGKRHNLRLDYQVIDKNGIMTQEAGIFAGQDVLTARENIVELLRSKGNLVKIEPYTHKVGYCSRGGCRIESIVSTQWFVKSGELAKKVIAGYKKGEFEIVPQRFEKTFEDWIYNLRDWCISRQLWWGHQIPAYYDAKTHELLTVTLDEESVYEKYGRDNVYRDADVLDTWFSAALWPFSILDWTPENPWELFKQFYPAQVIETGYDILFFWVIRMLLFGYEYTNQTPFKTIYLHGLILTEDGKKMSKSVGNVIDPLDVIEEYSTDALRLTCSIGNTPGNNLSFSMKNVENNSAFLNKLWNVTRFVHANIGEVADDYSELRSKMENNWTSFLPHEQWILSRLKATIDRVTDGMERFAFSDVGQDLTYFTRDEFADFFIEEYKITQVRAKETSQKRSNLAENWALEWVVRSSTANEEAEIWGQRTSFSEVSTENGRDVLAFTLLSLLKLWHPYVPFATEELYGIVTGGKTLIDSEWAGLDITRNKKIESDTLVLFEAIRTIRNIRATKGVKPGELVDMVVLAPKKSLDILKENEIIFLGLAKISEMSITKTKVDGPSIAYGVTGDIELFITLPENEVNTEEEKKRLREQIENRKEYLRTMDLKLLNADFVRNAPEKIVRLEQDKRAQAADQLKKLEEKFNSL